jgi:hypothetical protein
MGHLVSERKSSVAPVRSQGMRRWGCTETECLAKTQVSPSILRCLHGVEELIENDVGTLNTSIPCLPNFLVKG